MVMAELHKKKGGERDFCLSPFRFNARYSKQSLGKSCVTGIRNFIRKKLVKQVGSSFLQSRRNVAIGIKRYLYAGIT